MSAGPTAGFLEVGRSIDGLEVIVNHPDLKPDADGVGHIVFSPAEARNLARLLNQHASEAELAARLAREHAGPVGHGG